MKTLCLFTNEFPYGSWEPYLETEVKYYTQFDKVYVFSLQLRKEHTKTKRKLPENCVVIPVPYAPKWRYLLNSFIALGDKNLYLELGRLVKTRRLSIKTLVDLFVYISRAHYEASLIYKEMQGKQLGDTCFYSYRFEYQPYVAMLLKKKLKVDCKIISRAHRFDLYEEKRTHKYIPCREALLKDLTYVYPCSDDGTDYLRNRFPKYKEKIYTRFLGTIDHGIQDYTKVDVFRIVSCSTVTPVKRIGLIIDSLKCISEKKIEWTHFGDGPLMGVVEEQASMLAPNIRVLLKGNIENTKLLQIYKKSCFDLFVNVSKSEGIPVSIMEAMSFGIPCLATNAGGTGEIVKNGNGGILVPVEITGLNLAKRINSIICMHESEYMDMRLKAKDSWKKKYNADNNYSQFVSELIGEK